MDPALRGILFCPVHQSAVQWSLRGVSEVYSTGCYTKILIPELHQT